VFEEGLLESVGDEVEGLDEGASECSRLGTELGISEGFKDGKKLMLGCAEGLPVGEEEVLGFCVGK
jgi:hypothetical protein